MADTEARHVAALQRFAGYCRMLDGASTVKTSKEAALF
jgi:hypothetical protein